MLQMMPKSRCGLLVQNIPALLVQPDLPQTPLIVMLFIRMGVRGLSSRVGTLEMFTAMSMPLVTLPKTGCFDSPGENQSKKSLCTTLMKNCDPPVFGAPVLAMESVPGSLESLEINSSLMLPPLDRVSMPPVFKFLYWPSGGPPVPARRLFGSLACGHPNCAMNPGITRWKWTPL